MCNAESVASGANREHDAHLACEYPGALASRLPGCENGEKHGKLSFIDLAGSERGADVKTSDK